VPVPSITTNTRFGSAARHALLAVVSKVAPCLGRVPYLVTSARRTPPGLFLSTKRRTFRVGSQVQDREGAVKAEDTDMSVRTKKTVAATRREAVAYHEAGHAVVAHMLGYQVQRVSISPKPGSAGHVSPQRHQQARVR
jgi:hypothetical protein